ncbi:MAG TPA: uroporphyrinogen decarboxylase family protein [Chthonomonadaceae bacterium]|nr:uroporphyrinogen decarboxylase family protein [Chthonomonadaceae bacterium]
MPETMTSKERMLTAIRNEIPDRVPVAPDISNMIPARLTGKPLWDLYLYNDPPLWRAYIDAVRFFEMDGWFMYGELKYRYQDNGCTWKTEVVDKANDRITTRTTCGTPAGDLFQEDVYYRSDPPTRTRKWIHDLRADMPKLRYLFPAVTGYDRTLYDQQQWEAGDSCAVGIMINVPGMHDLVWWFDDPLMGPSVAYVEEYDLFKEFISWQEARFLKEAEMAIDARPDFILIGASGMWTLSSPKIWRDITLAPFQKITRMAKEAGVPTMLHSCGKERKLAQILAEETDLGCINPLEVPPTGDCDLAEVKQAIGSRMALMGNLHTVEVMLEGTPQFVEEKALQALRDAGANGGFILSTGDQCGRDTPDENIRAMVHVAKEHGWY